jgi:hypothetical protein
MLKARAKAFWSWDFQISGSSTGDVLTTLNRRTECGTIVYAGHTYEVAKQKAGREYWKLILDAQNYAEARGIPGLFSKIEIKTPEISLTAEAPLLSRRYDFSILERKVGTIAPGHLLTRESTIDFDGDVGELTQVFCFWMAALKWYYSSQD